jgi:hypothetical protein
MSQGRRNLARGLHFPAQLYTSVLCVVTEAVGCVG